MGVIIRQSITSTILTYIGVIIGYVNLLILFPRYMSPEEVGLQRTFQDAALLLVPFVQIGISQLTLKYFPQYKSKAYYAEFVTIIFSFFVVTALVFTSFYLFFEKEITLYFNTNSPEINQYLGLILALSILLALHQVLVAFTQSSLNIVLPNFLKEVVLRALTLIDIVLFATNTINFNQFIYLLAGAYFISFSILLFYLLNKKILSFSFKMKHFKSSEIKQMITYSAFTFLGASGILIIGKVDSIMVSGMLGLHENGIYATAFYIAVLIELPKRAIAQIGTPIISKAYKENNIEEVKTIYAKSSINNLIIGSILYIGICINLDNIFALIPNSHIYVLGKWVVLIVGAGKLIDMAAGLNGEIIAMSKNYKVNTYLIVLLTIFTVYANYLLIPIYGLEGAAIGSAIALLLYNFSKFLFLVLKEHLQPFSFQTVKVIAIGAVCLYVGLKLPEMSSIYLDIFVRSTVVSILFGGLILWFKPSSDVNNLASQIWSRIIRSK